MKHSYNVICTCDRCHKERCRRATQSRNGTTASILQRARTHRRTTMEDRRTANLMRAWDQGKDDNSDWS